MDYYESKGWMIGKNKMKDWKASIRTWEKKETTTNKKNTVDDILNDEVMARLQREIDEEERQNEIRRNKTTT